MSACAEKVGGTGKTREEKFFVQIVVTKTLSKSYIHIYTATTR